MKKIIPFLLISGLWFIGCSDDDVSGNFVGTWEGTSLAISNCQDDNRNGPQQLPCNDAQCHRLILNGDGTYSFQRGLPTTNGTWDADDFLRLCTDEEGEVSCEQFAYQFSGISLILTADSTSSGCISNYFFDLQMTADTTQGG